MAKLLAGPTWLTKRFTNCIAPSTLFPDSRSLFNPVGKCFFVKAATSVLFKDSGRGSRAESSKSAGNPRQSKSSSAENVRGSKPASSAKNPRPNAPKGSENPCEEFSAASKVGSPPMAGPRSNICNHDTTLQTSPPSSDPCSQICKPQAPPQTPCKPEITSRASSLLENPCARNCKLSPPPPCCEKTCTLGPCPEPPPDICPHTNEFAKKARFWKRATILGALPIVLLASIIISVRVKEEAARPRPEYVPMDYLYRRTKRFPWGDGNHTLFHNPEKNAVPPDGYEVEDPNAVVRK